MSGIFVVVEGMDGAGKGLLTDRLESRLQQAGERVYRVREPGGTPIGEAIRNVLKSDVGGNADATSKLLLFSAARRALVAEVVTPALASGHTVLSDRYCASTWVYQGELEGVPADQIAAAEQVATGGMQPTVELILLVSPQIMRQRVVARGGVDAMDLQAMTNADRLFAAYSAYAATRGAMIIDTSFLTPDEVADVAWQQVSRALKGPIAERSSPSAPRSAATRTAVSAKTRTV